MMKRFEFEREMARVLLHVSREQPIPKPAAGRGDNTPERAFMCKTCDRVFPSFQALGGHRTSHLRGRHGLALALTTGDQYFSVKPKSTTDQKSEHRCHICGQGFETGQALGGHMRRHRDEAVATTAQAPPVLLQLFV